jgi:hypothetical protein
MRLLAVALLSALVSQSAHAITDFSYGTGVYFGSGTSTLFPQDAAECCATPGAPLALNQVIFEDNSADLGTMFVQGFARARASPTSFSVGVVASSRHPGGLHTAFADAVAYTGFLVSGPTAPSQPAAIAIEGTIDAFGFGSGGFARFWVQDFVHSFLLADLNIFVSTNPLDGSPVTVYTYGGCNSETDCFGSGPEKPWIGGFLLPFSVPEDGLGVILEARSQADAAYNGGGEVGVNFLDTATVVFNPAAGTTVTLATGQVFGSAADDTPPSAVPEPHNVLLLLTALAGLWYFRRPSSIRRSLATRQ